VRVSRQGLGQAIRRARLEACFSRNQLSQRTGGRFSATAIGGYERGERAVSVERFVELAYAIGMAPEDLLSRALDDEAPRLHHRVTIDLTKLRDTDPAVREAVASFTHRMKLRRSDFLTDVLTLRAGDVVVVASHAEVSPAELIRGLAPAMVDPASGARTVPLP
jgi:transcriptional regulator with XRE-family HTH domain